MKITIKHVDARRPDRIDDVLARLGELARGQAATLATLKGQIIMSKADVTAIVERFDAATNEIAADLKSLRDQLRDGMSPAEIETLRASLDARVVRLEELGADPTDPIPTGEPDEPAEPGPA